MILHKISTTFETRLTTLSALDIRASSLLILLGLGDRKGEKLIKKKKKKKMFIISLISRRTFYGISFTNALHASDIPNCELSCYVFYSFNVSFLFFRFYFHFFCINPFLLETMKFSLSMDFTF